MSNNSNADIWIAGAIAAFTVDLVVYPLDTLKTRLQSPDYVRKYTTTQHGVSNGTNRALFRGLYQGVGSVVLATLPSSGAFFTSYEGVKAFLHDHNPRLSGDGSSPLLPQPLIHALASGTAEAVSCAILNPAEVIKQNAQMIDTSGGNVNATVQTLNRFKGNPFALWRGYTALVGRNLPLTAIQFPMFERLRQAIRQYRDDRGIRTNTLLEGGLITAASAGSAGAVAAVITTPLDVVKTRMMLAAADGAPSEQHLAGKSTKEALVDATGKTVQDAKEGVKEAVKGVKPAKQTGGVQIVKDIVRDQGVKGLFRGGALRFMFSLLGAGLYLGVYESGRLYLAQRRGFNVRDEEDI